MYILLALAGEAVGALALLANAMLVGTAAFDFLVWRRSGLPIGPVRTAAEHEMADLVLTTGRWSALAVVLLAVPRAVGVASQLSEHVPLASRVAALVLRSEWGFGLAATLLAGVVSLIGYAWAARNRRGGWPLIWAGVALIGIGAGLQGHPADVFAKLTIMPVLDGIHGVSTGAWLGTFFLLVLAERRLPAHTASPWTDPLGAMLGRYFQVSGSLASLVIITGLLSSAMHLRTLDDLHETEFGHLLAGKVGIVIILLMLNEHHRRHGERQARTAERTRLAHSLRFEAGLIGLILILTALMADATPPGANEVRSEVFRIAPKNAIERNDVPIDR